MEREEAALERTAEKQSEERGKEAEEAEARSLAKGKVTEPKESILVKTELSAIGGG